MTSLIRGGLTRVRVKKLSPPEGFGAINAIALELFLPESFGAVGGLITKKSSGSSVKKP